MLFDTHAHLNDPAFDEDRAELLETFKDAGVGLVLNAGCSLESSKDCIALADAYPWIYCSVGTHPDTADEVNEEVLEAYRQMCKHPKVKAIGEIGLTGEIRAVSNMTQRLTEVARLGFNKCIIPKSGTEKLEIPEGLTVYRVRNLREAIEIAL